MNEFFEQIREKKLQLQSLTNEFNLLSETFFVANKSQLMNIIKGLSELKTRENKINDESDFDNICLTSKTLSIDFSFQLINGSLLIVALWSDYTQYEDLGGSFNIKIDHLDPEKFDNFFKEQNKELDNKEAIKLKQEIDQKKAELESRIKEDTEKLQKLISR